MLAGVAGLALVVAMACFGQAWRAGEQRHQLLIGAGRHISSSTTMEATVARGPSPSLTTTTTAASSAVAPPIKVEVPHAGISAPVVPVGLLADGSMEIPAVTLAGWYDLGPAPGQVGPAVLVGHVDSQAGPAVFYRLTSVRAGDTVIVDRADGTAARFTVSKVTNVDKDAFPLEEVFGATPDASLRLITCTGSFNPRTRHYSDNLIVWATAQGQ